MKARRHPRIDEVVEVIRGVASESRKRDVLDHLEDCRTCSGRYALIQLIHTGRRFERSRRRGFLLAGVAVVVVAVAVVSVLWSGSDARSPHLEALATDEGYPEWSVEFFGSGVPAAAMTYEAELRSGVRALAAGELESATETLERLRQRRPDADEVAALLGIAYYLAGNDDVEVARLLEDGSSDPRTYIGRASRWYLANLHLRRGALPRAMNVLESLADETPPEYYSRLAADLLGRLSSGDAPR